MTQTARIIEKILLIDDDEINNFVCSKTIERSDISKALVIKTGVEEALEYLNSCIGESKKMPDLIFLDINMPVLNGWDFLSEYKKIVERSGPKPVLLILSSSVYQSDMKKAKEFNEVSGFISKPINIEMLQDIQTQYFS